MLTLRASVTPADRAADPYFYLPFDVPEGTTRIDATLAYPKAADCVIDLGCLDPRAGPWPAREGFRGWSGGARDGFFVATDDATPGYVHGPIPPGRWQVILGLYKLPPAGTEVTVTVALDAGAREIAPQPARSFPSGPARVGTGATSTVTPSTPTPAARPSCCTPPPGRPGSTSSPSPTTTPRPSAATSTRRARPISCSSAAWR